MSVNFDDPLWPHFSPLLGALSGVIGKDLLIAGGYGLFLKQHWLTRNNSVPIVVSIDRWRNAIPRVTKDVDLVLGLDLIANEQLQKLVVGALEANGFEVSDRPAGRRWQFRKRISGDQSILLEFHSPRPLPARPDIQVTKETVKHKPSLGEAGVHGRINPEAIGADRYPFQFIHDGVQLHVPNPVTWCIMKLTALRDRWEKSQATERSAKDRQFDQLQAEKHAADVCRVVAMMTREERDQVSEVVISLKDCREHREAGTICDVFFVSEQLPPVSVAKNQWEADDFTLIKGLLGEWFAV